MCWPCFISGVIVSTTQMTMASWPPPVAQLVYS
jgi:hypothetical protein